MRCRMAGMEGRVPDGRQHETEHFLQRETRFTLDFPADVDNASIEKTVLNDEQTQKYTEGKQIVKVIIVPKRIVNIVLK